MSKIQMSFYFLYSILHQFSLNQYSWLDFR